MPNVSVWARTAEIAALIAVSVAVTLLLSRNPVPEAADRPRPLELKFTPAIFSELVPVSLKRTFKLSPASRLMPLYEASPASWSICVRMLL